MFRGFRGWNGKVEERRTTEGGGESGDDRHAALCGRPQKVQSHIRVQLEKISVRKYQGFGKFFNPEKFV